MRKFFVRSVLGGAVVAFGVLGCATNPSNEDIGRIAGAVVGAGVGSLFGGGTGNTAMTVIGGIAGYVIGGNLGRNMDRADQERAAYLLRDGLEQPDYGPRNSSWRSQSGTPIHSRVATRPYYQDSRQGQCRSFVQETTIHIDGHQPQTDIREGVACLEYSQNFPRGRWVIRQ